jgi:predicted aldo/keto reductase-like oxidoreductase
VLSGVDDDIFIATKSTERNKSNFLMDIENSIGLLGRIPNLVHIHSVVKGEAPDILAKDGALDGAMEAKAEGMCHHIGLTSHDSPDDMCQIIRRCPDIDVVMVAINPGDTRFLAELVPLCRERGIGVLAMKVMARGMLVRPDGTGVQTAEQALRFALSCPGVGGAVVGFSYPEEIEELAPLCEDFEPMSGPEMRDLVDGTTPYAQELMFYRSDIGDWESPPDMRPSPDWFHEA